MFSQARIPLYIGDLSKILVNEKITDEVIKEYESRNISRRNRCRVLRRFLMLKNLIQEERPVLTKPALIIEIAIQKYINDLRIKNVSVCTIKHAKHALGFLRQFLEKNKVQNIDDINRKILNDFKGDLFQYRKKDGFSLEVSTQIKIIGTIKKFFKFLVKSQLMNCNPSLVLSTPRPVKKLSRKYFTTTEVNTLLEGIGITTLNGFRNRTTFELFYATGMRISELINLKVKDVCLSEEILHIREGKGKLDRMCILSPNVVKFLSIYISSVRSRIIKGIDSEALFVSSKGNPLDPKYFHRRLRVYCTKAGITRAVDIHTFRRSLATHLLEAGADVRYVQKVLGHQSVNTTRKYLRVTTENLRNVLLTYHPREAKLSGKEVRFRAQEKEHGHRYRKILEFACA